MPIGVSLYVAKILRFHSLFGIRHRLIDILNSRGIEYSGPFRPNYPPILYECGPNYYW
jgi:hypothetical protein